uniref:Plasminogen receptor with a C-terminal lysine n=2 Tax=Anas TaxID=8835 RepID=A0A493THD2_ANAPP
MSETLRVKPFWLPSLRGRDGVHLLQVHEREPEGSAGVHAHELAAAEYISLSIWYSVSCTLLDFYATHLAKLGIPNQLERQLLMQNQMRERQTAMQIAWTREFLKYFGTFFGLAAIGLTAGAIKKKNPGVLLPIVPLSFIFAYQYDMGYGTLLQRIKGEAENILDTQSALLEPPKGPLTFEELEKIRRSQSKFFIEK